jgi:hypothetical protein
VPTEHDVEVTTTTSELEVPIVVGGRFFVCATDGRGKCRAGKVTVTDANDDDVPCTFSRQRTREIEIGAVGELLPGGPNHAVNALPPGDYELRLDFDGTAPVRERVRIKAGETTRVDVRLP